MSVIDEVVKANEAYAENHELAHLSPKPSRRLAILTCMDTRLSKKTLGLRTGEAHILRNAGGIVTEDVVRSLVISHHLLGTQEFMVINHTDCGLIGQSEEDLRRLVLRRTGSEPGTPQHFFAFADIWSTGFEWKLGDHLNGYPARGHADRVEGAAEALARAACEHFPDSSFAQTRKRIA